MSSAVCEICGWLERALSVWAFVNACNMYEAECFDQAAFFMALSVLGEASAWGCWILNHLQNGGKE